MKTKKEKEFNYPISFSLNWKEYFEVRRRIARKNFGLKDIHQLAKDLLLIELRTPCVLIQYENGKIRYPNWRC